MDSVGPGGLRKNPAEVARRLERWESAEAYGPLRDYVASLAIRGRLVPAMDTDDAGPEARVLVLLESPGPRSATTAGTGIISVDNPDQTAANCWSARKQAGLFDGVLHWNVVPFELEAGRGKPTPVELAEGAVQLAWMLSHGLLPNLEAVILCGEYAKRGWRQYTAELIDGNGPAVLETWHPSAQGLIQAGKREQFFDTFAAAARLVA